MVIPLKRAPTAQSSFVQCAGQSCAAREGCLRYHKRGGTAWASFDIEQERLGDCPASLPLNRR